MSSFNYFSPPSNTSTTISLNSSLSFSLSTAQLSPSLPSISSSNLSTLNPDAHSYIPQIQPQSYAQPYTQSYPQSYQQSCPSTPSLNAGAAPYIPLPLKLNISKTPIPAQKTPCPSFAYYEQAHSAQMYNATCKYLERTTNHMNDETLSNISNTSMDTPIPASITSSVFSEQYNIDLIDIEPYEPNKNRMDIDQINNIIHDQTNDDIHPVIAALTEQESKQLLNAPIWTPNISPEASPNASPNKLKQRIQYSKIAIDENDYQFIIHPNKKPVKYGYAQANIASANNTSKIAKDEIVNAMHMTTQHIQYMAQPTCKQSGELYCESNKNSKCKMNRKLTEETENTNVTNIKTTAKSTQIKTKQETVKRRSKETPKRASADINTVRLSNNNLYSNKTSRIAIEGSHCYLNITCTSNDIIKMAYDTYDTITYAQIYGESRIAQPCIEQISYIYCKT